MKLTILPRFLRSNPPAAQPPQPDAERAELEARYDRTHPPSFRDTDTVSNCCGTADPGTPLNTR